MWLELLQLLNGYLALLGCLSAAWEALMISYCVKVGLQYFGAECGTMSFSYLGKDLLALLLGL